MKCTHCQATHNPEDVFCGNCGEKFKATHAASPARVQNRVAAPVHKPAPQQNPVKAGAQNEMPISYIAAGFIGAGIFVIIVLILGLAEFLGVFEQEIIYVFGTLCVAVLAGLVFTFIKKIFSLIHIAAFLGGTAIAFSWAIGSSNSNYDYTQFDYVREFGAALALAAFLYWIIKKNVSNKE